MYTKIQCKKYNSRISKPDCAKEIIKFVLYSFVDNKLIPNEKNFNYFFIASSGFSDPASSYLDKFNEEIVKESALENWTNEVIKKYDSFKNLKFNEISIDLIRKLSLLRISKIIPQQLDIELSSPYSKDIIRLFFEVRTVVDTGRIDELKAFIETQLKQKKIEISDEDIQRKFAAASLQLATYKDYLYNLPDSHINRNETLQVVNWIKTPLANKSSPVLLLVGNAGYGKSVILKDVYQSLLNEKKKF